MGELVTAKSQPIFKKTHELAKLVRDLKKMSKRALEVLEQGLESEDEKIRMMAADKLIKYYMDSAKEINTDSLNRLILEVKAQGIVGNGSTANDDENTPKLDFDNLHPDFRDNATDVEVIDMGSVNKI